MGAALLALAPFTPSVLAQLAGPAAAAPGSPLPGAVLTALDKAQVPPEALAVVVRRLDPSSAPPGQPDLLAWQAQRPMNPGSVMKLVTSAAALDLLGPAYTWRTPVWLTGPVRHGVLHGSLVIQGRGDPLLTLERVWLLLRRVQQAGVKRITGDIVLDRSAFAPNNRAPGDFDGEPFKPYNTLPDALLLSHKAVIYRFTPDPAAGVARVVAEPALADHRVQATVPLAEGPCGDWRTALQATPADPLQMRFGGRYAGACGEQHWPLAYPEPARFNARLLTALWREMGGQLEGTVRDGAAPTRLAPSFELQSPPLADALRAMNKQSLNLAAQQLFLSLALAQPGTDSASEAQAATLLQQWLLRRLPAVAEPQTAVVDSGSGLSRTQRLSANQLAALLQWAWTQPWAEELLSSLPLNGVDGTLRRSAATPARAHLKTGSLDDVAALAGVVVGAQGQRLLLVALVQHAKAPAARPALDALLQWAIDEASAR
ncbi:D-alanyl-D-alanine carboxypeptidase, serine-type, PBP4 family [Burkholderiales bacterium JOSHI_001]|nr:D-alanyl-D-alanine carboxypeptidase, serine-type, PBP4 family [Burkholderiales bacterium JOSHI_001]